MESKVPIPFPFFISAIPHIPLPQPVEIVGESALAVPYTVEQKAISVAERDIDWDRIVPSRSNVVGGAKKPYSVAELRAFAKQLGLSTSGSKAELVKRLRESRGLS